MQDLVSGGILLQKDSQIATNPASTTKMMTALVAREHYALDQILEVTDLKKVDGNTVDLFSGEQVSVRELITAALVNSGNDAALVLAKNYPGGELDFVEQMNQRAQGLSLVSTHFTNAVGYDEVEHISSAADLAVIAQELMKDDFLRSLVGTKQVTIFDRSGQFAHYLENTNELLWQIPGVVGIKTGTTPLAGQVLVTQVEDEQKKLLLVLMGSQDRYQDAKKIISWIEQNYLWLEVSDSFELE